MTAPQQPAQPGPWVPDPAPTASNPPPLPVQESAYHHFLRTPAFAPWRPAAALVVGALLFFLAQVLGGIPLYLDVVTGRASPADLQQGRVQLTPWVLLGVNLGIAAGIGIAMAMQRWFFGQRPGWLSSVTGRLRWGWLLLCLLVLTPLWFGVLALQVVASGEAASTGEGTPSPRWALYLAIILITTPLQCAGEEYAFRGLANRAVASWFRDPRIGLVVGGVVSSLLFAFGHGSSDLWANLFYFGLGLLLCLLAWRTGGLEASIVLHTVNNLVVFLSSVASGAIDRPTQLTGVTGDWTTALSPLLGLLVLAAVEGVARWSKVVRESAPGRELIMDQPTVELR